MPPLVNRHSHRVGRNRAGRARVPRYTTEGPPRPDPSSSCGCGTPCQRRSRGGPQRPRGPRARPRLARQSRSSCRRTLSCCPIRSLQRHGDHRTAVDDCIHRRPGLGILRWHCQVDEKHVNRPPRYWALARREPTMLGITNGRQPQLDNTANDLPGGGCRANARRNQSETCTKPYGLMICSATIWSMPR